MSIKLIINADDLGYTAGVNDGIAMAFSRGIVSSTSLMMNQPGTEYAIDLVRKSKVPPAGVHLVLTSGKPLCPPRKIPSLVDAEGNFFPVQEFWKRSLHAGEVQAELEEQFLRVREAGIKITHLDTHHHVHAHPCVLEALLKIAVQYNLPARSLDSKMREIFKKKGIATPGYFCGGWFGTAVSFSVLETFLEGIIRQGIETAELMTHPGRADVELARKSSYTSGRELELAILCAKKTGRRIRELGLEPCDYSRV